MAHRHAGAGRVRGDAPRVLRGNTGRKARCATGRRIGPGDGHRSGELHQEQRADPRRAGGMNRVRLVKVTILPQFVIDDGDALEETTTQPREIRAADWPNVLDMVEQSRKAFEDQINAEPADEPAP